MKLKIVNSGSSGNSYILENENEILLIEAGMPLKKVNEFIDFNTKKIKGMLITHEHL